VKIIAIGDLKYKDYYLYFLIWNEIIQQLHFLKIIHLPFFRLYIFTGKYGVVKNLFSM
jgi:hypothetical protein